MQVVDVRLVDLEQFEQRLKQTIPEKEKEVRRPISVKRRKRSTRHERVVEPEPRRRPGYCRCGKKMKDTTTADDLTRFPDRIWLECGSCGTRAHRDKGKRTEWFPPSTFREMPQSLSITAPPEKSRPTDYRLKHPRPGGPHSHKTY